MSEYHCIVDEEILTFRNITLLDEIRIQEEIPTYMEKALSGSLDMGSVCKVMAMVCTTPKSIAPIADGKEVLATWEVLASKIKSEEDSARLVNTYSAICRGSRPVDEADDKAQKKKKIMKAVMGISIGLSLIAVGILIGSLLKL